MTNAFDARATFTLADGSEAAYYRLGKLEELGLTKLGKLRSGSTTASS